MKNIQSFHFCAFFCFFFFVKFWFKFSFFLSFKLIIVIKNIPRKIIFKNYFKEFFNRKLIVKSKKIFDRSKTQSARLYIRERYKILGLLLGSNSRHVNYDFPMIYLHSYSVYHEGVYMSLSCSF